MQVLEKRFYKSYGNCKVILKDGFICQPFQDIKSSDIIRKDYYNRFTYESKNKLYDIEIYYNGKKIYYINMKKTEKCIYHDYIEKKYFQEILETIIK